jgi:anti-sigma factor ChrR (cupin superfamily)
MKVNADLRERVVIQIDALPWVPSPLPGVERRMLDRDGEEVARATSVVRYAPNSRFDAHTHGGGEEYFVLEGVFSDEHGDFGPGSYVRNPPGSAHTPRSDQGCTIFVKLRQMADEDQTQVSIDTTDAAGWTPGPQPGVEALPLHRYDKEVVRLLRLAPGVRLEAHGHPAGEEILVLEGSFEDEHGRYAKGTWIRNPPGSDHRPSTETGCLLYIKTGHLPA